MLENLEYHVMMAKQGSDTDIEIVFKACKASVEICAHELKTVSLDFEDAVQEGNIGLFKAILSYSPNNKASFLTYAKKCILNNILSAHKSSQSQKHQVLTNAKLLEDDVWLVNPEMGLLIKEQNVEFISTAKEKLSDFEFLVFSLYTMQYSYKEIARVVNRDEKSVNNAVQRIHKKLRK